MKTPTTANGVRDELIMLREENAKLKAYAKAERKHLLCLKGLLPPRTYDSFQLRDEAERLRVEILPLIEDPHDDHAPPRPDPRPVPGPRPEAQAAPGAGAASIANGCGYPSCIAASGTCYGPCAYERMGRVAASSFNS